MVGVLAVPTFAATIGDDGIANSSDTTVNIPKSITVMNSGFDKSYSPTITYTFSITPSSNLGKIKDANNIQANVKAGIAGGITSTASVSFTPELVEDAGATSLAEEVVKNIELTVDLTKFTDPGVYRYTITDTTTEATLEAAGITRGSTFDPTRELDVYIVRNSTSGSLEISGYVLLDEIPPIVVDGTVKSPGYVKDGDIIETHEVGQDGIDGTDDDVYTYSVGDVETLDRYVTVNYDVTKIIDGNMADSNHEWAFTAEVATSDKYFAGVDAQNAEEKTATQFTFALKGGETYYVYAVNPKDQVTFSEENNSSNTCLLTATVNQQIAVENYELAPDSNYGVVTVPPYAGVAENAPTNISVVITNLVNAPSTTGFLMRVLPFIALAGLMGGALVVIKKVKFGKEDK